MLSNKSLFSLQLIAVETDAETDEVTSWAAINVDTRTMAQVLLLRNQCAIKKKLIMLEKLG